MQRTQVLFPAATWQLTSTCNCSFRKPSTLFWPSRVPSMHAVEIHTSRQNIHIHKIEINISLKIHSRNSKKILNKYLNEGSKTTDLNEIIKTIQNIKIESALIKRQNI